MIPEAMPASFISTPTSAAIVTGTNEKPRPTPARMKPGARSVRYEPLTDTWLKYSNHADGEHGAHADLRDERLGRRGRHDDRARDEQVADAGAHGRVAEHLLHVER